MTKDEFNRMQRLRRRKLRRKGLCEDCGRKPVQPQQRPGFDQKTTPSRLCEDCKADRRLRHNNSAAPLRTFLDARA